jgi:hypothetical protein
MEILPNGYQESIQKGVSALGHFNRKMSTGTGTKEDRMKRLADELKAADAIVIGAGADLSTSAGFTYSGERFEKYFFDFAKKYGCFARTCTENVAEKTDNTDNSDNTTEASNTYTIESSNKETDYL